MARKTESAAEPPAPEAPLTQRAYTLCLRGTDTQDDSWRDALWATHEAVNKGAKVFGEWLLTLRGGLSHELAEPPPPPKGKKRRDDDAIAVRKHRRILLALSWLSVEDERGAPNGVFRVASGRESDSARHGKVLEAFKKILESRGIIGDEADSWVNDCTASLSSAIREDAVWVNRSAMFDAAVLKIGPSLTRDEVWDILEPFFGSREAYFAGVELTDEKSSAEEKAKDLVQKAGQWLSSRFGTGTGADFESMSKVYAAMAEWADAAPAFPSGADAIKNLAHSLADFRPATDDAGGILGLISGPGYKSATRNIVKNWESRTTVVTRDDLRKFAETATNDEHKSMANVGAKGRRPWSDRVLEQVEHACGFTYLQTGGPARHKQFSVMLDHAARRVSIAHSWIKRAEAERRRFEADAQRLGTVPADAAAWLDAFVQERSGSAGGEYRIRRRAIEGWDEVLKRWARSDCKTAEDRIAAAREVQADPEIDKFGDIQLFEALASDDALCVWKNGDNFTPDQLKDYVFAHDARFKQRRFKVPAYRHPDALRHPVFGDFGNSRWKVEYSALEAAKAARGGRRIGTEDADWLGNPRSVRLGLWNGDAVNDFDLRWSCKRLSADLALWQPAHNGQVRSVSRADRLGRAASGIKPDDSPSPAGLFSQAEWNARLQAPRSQLNDLAAYLDRNGGRWDDKAKRMRDRLAWLVTFSAKLECRGPFIDYAARHGINANRKGEYYPNADRNKADKREGHAKLILSRLPGLRVLSVDLGHRFAAACAVWEALPRHEFEQEIRGREIIAGGTGPEQLFCHTRYTDKAGKARTTVYRRIGSDTLPDGSEHPAPWTRLDRQFLIKLQGEDAPARKASPDEIKLVERLENELGRRRDDGLPLPRRVDDLMAEAVRTLRLGLRRHGRVAKIAYAFNPDCPGIPGMGGALKAIARGNDDHIKFLVNALADWHAMATDAAWDGSDARQLWNQHIKPVPNGFEVAESTRTEPNAERTTRQQRRKTEEELREKLRPIAEHFARASKESTRGIYEAWRDLWESKDGPKRTKSNFAHTLIHDQAGKVIGSRTAPKQGAPSPEGWHLRLRQTTDWITGRRPPGNISLSPGWKQHVGGLSLTRISTMRALYQLHKAFAMRPRPDKVQGAPERGESNAGTAQSILDAMERMREQRVKQLASHIAEAALGVGRMKQTDGRDRKRPRSPVDAPCHAIVIESLRNYRPDELQTRRENRALMNWSAGKVRKYLEEACQLHALHLREVMPNYTSRQCSRTGLPGMRCEDVPIDEFLSAPWWKKMVNAADKRLQDNGTDSQDRLLVELQKKWSIASDQEKRAQRTLRLPRAGGDLFVTAPPNRAATVEDRSQGALQADLNAAANIGLRALLDPDFPGRWWYIPCIEDKA
ncbi:MAG: hypothetical protein D6692_07605, partial [Planctomycetota bacterium]